jgi:hypothetical protein
MTTDKSEYRPKYIKIIIAGVIVFFLINSISLAARSLFSKELFGATVSPLILTFVSVFLGIRYFKGTKKNLAWGLILGAVINVAFWIYFFVALSFGL